MVNNGSTNKEIAEVLNRTIDSIKHHRSKLFPSQPANIKHWTNKENSLLMKLSHEGKTNREIAEILKRSTNSIESRKKELREKGLWIENEIEMKPRSLGASSIFELVEFYKEKGYKKITIIIE